MLEIKNLVKRYNKFIAVNNLNLSIEDKSLFGFIGPNGAGKTTTMKIIVGLLKATSGSVIINDIDVLANPNKLKEKVGYVPDFFGVYDNLKVDEYMDFYAGTYYIPYKDRKQIIDNLLDIVNLTDKKDSYVDLLSRGMKQRLCLARSLIHNPEILVLDEPASGLDPRARVDIKEVLKQLREMGKTIMISSHILSELSEMCTSIGIIDKGQIIVSGTVNDIMKKLTCQKIISIKLLDKIDNLMTLLLENPQVSNISQGTDTIEFSFDGEDIDTSRLLSEIVRNDIPLISFKEKEGNLEEIFMQVTNREEETND